MASLPLVPVLLWCGLQQKLPLTRDTWHCVSCPVASELGLPRWLSIKNLAASAGDAGDMDSVPGLERFRGGTNGNLPQYSCLENLMDRGAWWATVHGVEKSWTWLNSWACTHSSFWIDWLQVWPLFAFEHEYSVESKKIPLMGKSGIYCCPNHSGKAESGRGEYPKLFFLLPSNLLTLLPNTD